MTVIDDALIHGGYDCVNAQACREASVVIGLLRPYSRACDRIEESFNEIKAWIERDHDRTKQFQASGDFLQHA